MRDNNQIDNDKRIALISKIKWVLRLRGDAKAGFEETTEFLK